MGIDFEQIRGELQAFACFEKAKWLKDDGKGQAQGRRRSSRHHDEQLDGVDQGPRNHVFKPIWERTLDPQGRKKAQQTKSDELSIDWKKWPPAIPTFPKGLRIPVTKVPYIEVQLSANGNWNHMYNGTATVPINSASKEFYEGIGGYLNLPQSEHFKVSPPSLMFLQSIVGVSYQTRVTLSNAGTKPRRVTILSPPKPHLIVMKDTDPKNTVSSGGHVHFTVTYKPIDNKPFNDVILFHVEDDGAIAVPVISSGMPEPILEVEEWNCGCCMVGVPRTVTFEVKNLGGDGRFWILSESEFSNEYLECYSKYQEDVIQDSSRRAATEQLMAAFSQQKYNDMMASGGKMPPAPFPRPRQSDEVSSSSKGKKVKLRARIYTTCFRIHPSCFRLQRNQKVDIKVKYFPKSPGFHYEKLAILCENGEVRWIAVKGLGIAKNSNTLIEVKAKWTGPPVDLPFDPRTNFVLDCGDLISGELSKLTFSIANKSCIPLFYFWSIRPLVSDPAISPDTAEVKMMGHFYEYTVYDRDSLGNSLFTAGMVDFSEEEDTEIDAQCQPPVVIEHAQGLLEKKQESQLSISVRCPKKLGYHACVISLYAEQVDEASRETVLDTLQQLDSSQITKPISQVALSKQLADTEEGDIAEKVLFPVPYPAYPAEQKKSEVTEDSGEVVKLFSHDNDEEKDDKETEAPEEDLEGFVPLKQSIQQFKKNREKRLGVRIAGDQGGGGDADGELHRAQSSKQIVDASLLPFVVAKRSRNLRILEENQKKKGGYVEETTNDYDDDEEPPKPVPTLGTLRTHSLHKMKAARIRSAGSLDFRGSQHSMASTDSNQHRPDRTESMHLHLMQQEEEMEETLHDRSMNQGHGVYEDVNLYTENVVPKYQLWPDRAKYMTPVAEVEIWMRSVPFDVTFTPPFIIANGTVRSKVERLIRVKNGTRHKIQVDFESITDNPIPLICSPGSFSVKPFATGILKVLIYFDKCGEVQRVLKGTISLPFLSTPCAISALLKSAGPYLQVLTPTISFGMVPLLSETMKTLALKNSGNRGFKWIARITSVGMQNENKRELSGHQNRVHDKRVVRIWPEWGILEPGESFGLQVYFSAELTGQICAYVEVMVEGNPDSLVTIPVYGEVEQSLLVLEKGSISFYSDDFINTPTQTASCTIINPSRFNVPFVWESPVGRQCKLCSIHIHPRRGIVPSNGRMECVINVQSLVKHEPLILDNLFIPCCVKGMKEPLILKVQTTL